jgi:glycosyltransferase involved in cell wall biosynthesis
MVTEIKLEYPLVSIVMPVYNDEKFVGEAIQSIINQRYTNWELIVVNDGSLDRTREVVNSYINQEPRARLVDKENSGTGLALNKGFLESNPRGKYYTWCSSDNVYYPDMLASLVKALENCDKAKYKFAYSDFEYINQNNRIINRIIHSPIPRTDLQNGYDLGMSFMYTAELFKQVGGFWDKIIEDYEFAVKAAQYTEFLLVPEILAAYRVRQGQITGSRKEEESRLAAHCRDLAKELIK